ncbi:YkgJ family cysteine cluster protein [Vulgatibacter sp.]|uniref:YkgJ family cysteine cluster protein n=1 Tax=Vulgatibacter sp. TaxID=1971226 RepID=UPI0035624972
MDELNEYRAAVARVEAFAAGIAGRRSADMACRAGCDACCQVELEVAPVEAAAVAAHLASLPAAQRDAIAATAEARQAGRCVMLGDDGRCRIYEARPLVCRTQGLPLRYPPGFVPAGAVGLDLGEKGQATWCPLNFTERLPEGADVLDAELVDRLLAVVNHRWCAQRGLDPLARFALAELARSEAPGPV